MDSLKHVVVGCGRMGRGQAKVPARLAEFQVTAVCDTDAAHAAAVAQDLGVRAYTDYDLMLQEQKPDTVSICTPNVAHAAQTIAAVRAGVKGVYCEKPMATNLGDARAMVRACQEKNAALVVNHQRRINADLVEMRRLMDSGATGEIKLVRGNCAGDILSDGTHLVDSIMWLTGDQSPTWVFGQVHRIKPAEAPAGAAGQGYEVGAGFRFGHPIETGGVGVFLLPNGVRVEICCGDLRDGRRCYQDYEVFGTKGRLWRTGDGARPNLFIQDAKPGTWGAGIDNKFGYKPIPLPEGAAGDWRPVELPADGASGGMDDAYRRFARMIHEGAEHPMSGVIALRGFEVIMAVYEAARVHQKLTLPLAQERFPLELMLEAGQL